MSKNKLPTDADGKEVVEIEQPKPTKKSLNLARKIVEQRATIARGNVRGWTVDLMSVIGFHHENITDDQNEAMESAAVLVALALDNKELVLADNWAKDNLN